MKKLTKLIMVAGALSFVATGAFAGLTLCSTKNITQQIDVKCGPEGKGVPIPPNGGCTNDLPWSGIREYLAPSGVGECDFYIGSNKVASAEADALITSGSVFNVQILDPTYTTNPAPSTFPSTDTGPKEASMKITVDTVSK